MKAKNVIILLVALILLSGISLLGVFGIKSGDNVIWKKFTEIKTGLDISGGVQIVYQAKQDGKIEAKDLDTAKAVLGKRLEMKNIYDYTVRVDYDINLVYLEIPTNKTEGSADPLKAVEGLDKTAQIQFKDPEGAVVISGSDIKNAVYSDTATEETGLANPHVVLTFNDSGRQKFADATERLQGKYISICMDDKVISSPMVSKRIDSDTAIITMGTSDNATKIKEAKELSVLISSGALPFSLNVINKEYIGPSVGYKALNVCILAGIIACIVVFIFMIILYRLPGLIADITLLIYIAIYLSIMAQTGITLTLPGIAGLVLSVGMAVDANILIFERLKEEVKNGRTASRALDDSYSSALVTIVDSNVTTLIAAFMLYIFGIGPIKGFGIVLATGTLVSMFVAVVISKILMRQIIGVINKDTRWFMSTAKEVK